MGNFGLPYGMGAAFHRGSLQGPRTRARERGRREKERERAETVSFLLTLPEFPQLRFQRIQLVRVVPKTLSVSRPRTQTPPLISKGDRVSVWVGPCWKTRSATTNECRPLINIYWALTLGIHNWSRPPANIYWAVTLRLRASWKNPNTKQKLSMCELPAPQRPPLWQGFSSPVAYTDPHSSPPHPIPPHPSPPHPTPPHQSHKWILCRFLMAHRRSTRHEQVSFKRTEAGAGSREDCPPRTTPGPRIY